MTAYYNEIDPYAAQWLRNLIKDNLIAPGDVDERDIRDVKPSELKNYTQCHFFAGIGGWPQALRIAEWPDDQPVWTGSCPCQPFSTAGTGKGFTDERHLWPALHWLIQERRPSILFGEQVANGPAKHWIDLVSTDLEGVDYAFGASSLPACSVGAPHKRQRTYFMANDNKSGRKRWRVGRNMSDQWLAWESRVGGERGDSSMARPQRGTTKRQRCEMDGSEKENGQKAQEQWIWDYAWNGSVVMWIKCRDGKIRPIEPGTWPLVDGFPERMDQIRAYGNAIAPPLAAKFIEASIECLNELAPSS